MGDVDRQLDRLTEERSPKTEVLAPRRRGRAMPMASPDARWVRLDVPLASPPAPPSALSSRPCPHMHIAHETCDL